MSRVDLASPGTRAVTPRWAATEVQRLAADFNRMLGRLEEQRRDSGRAVLRAQEEERSRIAQDLHDEVNQALTAILLRLSATISDAPEGLQDELRETQQLVIYRVTQESLSNIAQHADARHVDVELSAIGRTVLRIRDDGRGFKGVPKANGRAHLGLSGMRERALLVGGRLNIFSEPGEGTTIELTMEAR
jgi:signal transduction histidine kinase